MTFETLETSVDEGRPIELMIVSFLTNHWYYTTSETQVVYDGNTYLPLPISHNEVSTTGDVSKSSLTIKVPQDCPIGELFRVQPPSGVVTVTVFLKHVDAVDAKVIWKGRIVNAEWESPWLSLTSENVFSSLMRTGLRRKYGVQCPHALYGQGDGLCNVNRESYRRDYVVGGVTGASIYCAALLSVQPGFFAGGFLTWVNNVTGYLERRMVKESTVSGLLIIPAPPPGLTVGQVVSAYPGCDHSTTMCDSRFGNVLNYGGTPFIPSKNPFGGSTIY